MIFVPLADAIVAFIRRRLGFFFIPDELLVVALAELLFAVIFVLLAFTASVDDVDDIVDDDEDEDPVDGHGNDLKTELSSFDANVGKVSPDMSFDRAGNAR